jgi:hypothetical protein
MKKNKFIQSNVKKNLILKNSSCGKSVMHHMINKTSDLFSFAHSSILSSYIDVLRTYPSNTPYLNHCIIRMFYRVSVDCNFPGIFFQMSLFRILQKFHLDPLGKSKQFSVCLI